MFKTYFDDEVLLGVHDILLDTILSNTNQLNTYKIHMYMHKSYCTLKKNFFSASRYVRYTSHCVLSSFHYVMNTGFQGGYCKVLHEFLG